jgi:hypothetical protein
MGTQKREGLTYMRYRTIRDAGTCLECGTKMKKGQVLVETFLGDIHASCHKPKPSTSYQAKKVFESMLKEQAKHDFGLSKRKR